ncbi:MAG: tRNA pseudouridine(55) synthase TruB [Candidatus Omnitrophica bacterium]|nr:tRNA pseudouridine(55) synthase TruB [Candidatus Omnitrophota bacterium]
MQDTAGILIVDKEKGMTSHDVVQAVRRRFGIKKVGHAGTLDPNATGVLVLLLGRATKLSSRYSADEKEYLAVMKLGEKTDTGDSCGKIIERAEVRVSPEELSAAARSFIGESYQTPPMVSAKKVNGKRLYKLARKGLEVKRKPQKIFIEKIEIIESAMPFATFSVICSKGTYIRQLAEDIGEKLGCGAHLTELRRTRSGTFTLEGSARYSDLVRMTGDDLNESIIRLQES